MFSLIETWDVEPMESRQGRELELWAVGIKSVGKV